MSLVEDLVLYTMQELLKANKNILDRWKRDLIVPKKPFKRITYKEAYKKYGKHFELELSKATKEPFWLTDFPIEDREFYDREDPERPGILLDMDLIYPEGSSGILNLEKLLDL